MIRAQRLAYHLIHTTREWNGRKEGLSLLDDRVLSYAVDVLSGSEEYEHLSHVTRADPDRVSSLFYWDQGGRESFAMLNLGLPRPL